MQTKKITTTTVAWTFEKNEIRALLTSASKDTARVNLCVVHIGDHAVTTDGHSMLCGEPETEARGRAVNLQRAPLEVLHKTKGCRTVQIIVGPKVVEGVALDRHETEILRFPLPEADVSFPPYLQVFPDAEPEACEPCFNPAMLGPAMTALSGAGVTTASVRMSGPLDPIVVCGRCLDAGGRWAYVLMPMRASTEHWSPRATRAVRAA